MVKAISDRSAPSCATAMPTVCMASLMSRVRPRHWSCVSVGFAKKDVTVARKQKKHSLLSCCLATKTPDADCQEARDDVSVTSLEDHVRNTLDF